jgi:2-keto-4-pentenoate hydratase
MNDLADKVLAIHEAPASGHAERLRDLDVTLESGQLAQLDLLQHRLDAGESVGGWKIGMTSGASRNAMGNGVRPFGFILRSRILAANSVLLLADMHKGQVENELCFVLGSTLGAGATATDARRAVQAVLPAFEINQKRLPAGVSPGVRVADDLSNWGIVIGDPVESPTDLSKLSVTLSGPDGEIETVASAGHIDDHYQSLATLARGLAVHGRSLEPGQYVITGAYCKTPFAPGRYTGEFNLGIGAVSVVLE